MASGSSANVVRKALSYRYTITDVAVFKFGSVKSAPFTVVLKGDKDSKWHVLIEKMKFDGSPYLRVCLCQEWSGIEAALAAFDDDRDEDEKPEMRISKCRLKFLNPDSDEVFFNDTPDSCQSWISTSSTATEKAVCVWCEIPYSRCVHQGKLTLQVEAEISYIDDDAATIPPDGIREGMYELYRSGSLTDVIIKCEDKEFKVHKAVLASQSPVFRAMFEADMREAHSGVVEISGITSAALSDFIVYMYTGAAPNLNTLANELLDVADRYQVERLVLMSEGFLKRKIKQTVVCVVETLLQAQLFGRARLKKTCLEFIRLNAAEVFQSSEWKSLKDENPSLYLEALEYCVPVI